MRRYLVTSMLGVCVLLLASAATALAGGSTYYIGQNSQGQKLLFSVDHTASGPEFDPFFTTMIDHCPVTGDTITVGFTFQGFQIPLKNGKFSLPLRDISDRFNWTGTVTSAKASGTESYSLAGFDNAGGLQDCATGPLTWTATGLSGGSAQAAPHTAYAVTVSKASDGTVHFTVTHR